MHHIGRNSDGTLWNPDGHPEDIVRELIEDIEKEQAERRSQGAKEAAKTRQRRQHNRIWSAAKTLLAGKGIGERASCAICLRGLTDPESMKRGIGSECWQYVLTAVEQLKAKSSTAAA